MSLQSQIDGGSCAVLCVLSMMAWAFATPGIAGEPDSYFINQGQLHVGLDVLSNDQPDARQPGGARIIAVGASENGGTVVNHGTALEYTPPSSFSGVDRFEYVVATEGRGEQPTPVSVAVTGTAVTWRVMPLGGSITEGENPYNSWRRQLWHDLTAAGFDIDMVGSKSGNRNGQVPNPDFDTDHQGHWGWRIDEFLQNDRIANWAQTYLPDAVLIHLGTNDMAQGQPVAETIDELSQIVDALRAANPGVIVVIAQLIPADRTWAPRLVEFNQQVPLLADAISSSESPVVALDQAEGFDAVADTYDGIHPNTTGEAKMAVKWYGSLAPLINTEPVLDLPISDIVVDVGASVAIDLNDHISDPDGIVPTFSSSQLPAGLTLDVASGVISGTATVRGVTTITVTGTDAFGAFADDEFVLTANDPVTAPRPKKSGGGAFAGPADLVLFVMLVSISIQRARRAGRVRSGDSRLPHRPG